MRDEDLSALLSAPELDLEPPRDLLASVERGARRVRRRRTAAGAALSAVALGGAVLVLPGLSDGGGRTPDRVAAQVAARFPQATTSVELLERLNGGDVVTFYIGTRWCTGSARTLVNDGCRGYVADGEVAPFALYLLPGDPSLRIDEDTVTAGVLGTGVARVGVGLADGTELPASAVSGEGFPRPVWWAAVPRGQRVVGYTAYDAADQVVAVLVVSDDEAVVDSKPVG